MDTPITPLHRYRVHLIPRGIESADVEAAHAAGLLPRLQFRAPSTDWAAGTAHHVTGQAVHSVERIEDEITSAGGIAP